MSKLLNQDIFDHIADPLLQIKRLWQSGNLDSSPEDGNYLSREVQVFARLFKNKLDR